MSLSKFTHGVMPTHELHTGLKTLKKRQHNFMLLFIVSSSLCIATIIAGFLQQDLVGGFFGLTQQVEQLHVPISAQHMSFNIAEQDYFMGLVAWFGWLILKILVSFIGAFFVIHFLKKLRFFYVRFQSFVLKFVGWLIAFIVLWSGLTYVQYDLKDDQADRNAAWIEYGSNIQNSLIYQELQQQNTSPTLQAYLLAQTALLHKPADLAAAQPYVQHLIQAEQQPNFAQYGFKAEQLWSMQQQVYGQSMSASSRNLAPQVAKVEQTTQYVQKGLIVSGIFWLSLSLIFWLLAQYFARRNQRIDQRITS